MSGPEPPATPPDPDPGPTTPAGPSPSSPTRRFRTPLRGHAFAGPVPDEALTPGRAVSLVREPDNPADTHAVAVWVSDDQQRSWRVGYLDRTVAARIAPSIDGGRAVTAVLEGWIEEPGGRWERPMIRVEVAPAPEQGRAAESVQATVWGRPPGVRRRRLDPPS